MESMGPRCPQAASCALPLERSTTSRNVNVGLRRRVAVILRALSVRGWRRDYGTLVNLGQQRLIEIKALDVAEVARDSPPARAPSYAERVRETSCNATESATHRKPICTETGNVPLPAQFLKFVGEHASKDNGAFTTTRP